MSLSTGTSFNLSQTPEDHQMSKSSIHQAIFKSNNLIYEHHKALIKPSHSIVDAHYAKLYNFTLSKLICTNEYEQI